MSEYEAYERKMTALLAEWPDRMALMESRAPAIPESRRATYHEILAEMRARYGDAVRALSEFRGAAAGSEPARAALEKSWANLAAAYEKALCQFEGVKN